MPKSLRNQILFSSEKTPSGNRCRKAEFRKNLISFFNQEILFFSDPQWQQEAWLSAHGDLFGQRIARYLIAWESVENNRKDANITDKQFEKLVQFSNLFRDFGLTAKHPQRSSEYDDLLKNREWRKIQSFAQEIYQTIDPTI